MNQPIDLERLTPGRHKVVLRVEAAAGQPTLDVPVYVLRGRRPRPRLAVVGGVHGDEYDGIRAAQRLAAEQAPDALDGTLVVIPVANPSSFAAGQRPTVLDGVDLNRVFPGKAHGSVSERLAHTLTQAVLRHMDLIFTLHGGGAVTRLAWYLEFLDADTDTGRRSRAAAAAAGFANLIAFAPETEGYLLPALGRLGVPVIEGEVGGRGELHLANVDYYLERVADVLAHLGLVPKRVRAAAAPISKIWQNSDVTAAATGILQRDVALHQAVSEGQRLAAIVDIEGRELAQVVAPVDGVVGGYREHSWIQTGQMAIRLFVPVASGS